MLPNISEKLTHSIKIGEGLFVIRPWKTKDERAYMLKSSTYESSLGNNITSAEQEMVLFNELIKPCIISGDYKKLSGEGLKRLIYEIRIISMGDEIQDFKFTCSACSKPNMTTLIIGDKIKYKQFDKNWHKINEKLSVKFKPIHFEDVFKILETKNNEVTFVIKSIEAIEYEGKVYDDFSEEELTVFCDDLDLKSFKIISENLIKAKDETTVDINCRCMFCNEETKVEMDGDNDFL
jgi:hypothetical protein